jgi:murein DD-endopeptidase MepM/ murein hydrolase activator NlpD
MAKGNDTSKPCPTKQRIGEFGIDEIYGSQNNSFTASGWTHMKEDAITSHSSDHTPVYVTLTLPGSDSTGNAAAGGFSWPVNFSFWQKNRSDFLDGHTFKSSTFTSPSIPATSVDISSSPINTPVYSMLGGKVKKVGLCSEGGGIEIESSIQGGTLDIAYGHGIVPGLKAGDTVKSGQHIMNENQIGCKVTGPHVHIDMSFNGQHVCPQDIFLAMSKNNTPDLAALAKKVGNKPTSCARV